jgi:hypothetical protein
VTNFQDDKLGVHHHAFYQNSARLAHKEK